MKAIEGKLQKDARTIFQSALKASDAGQAVRRHLQLRGSELRAGPVRLKLTDYDRVFLVAAGKAAVAMSAAVEEVIGTSLHHGVAVTKHGHAARKLRHVQIVEAGHPIPDASGVAASTSIQELLRDLNARDLLLVAISGGASALLSAPAQPATLADKQKTTDLLLRAGADIFQLNAVRKHLSALKGGRLAACAYPARVVSLLLSDVIGDALDIIGSGPTAPDSSTFTDALAVLDKFELRNRVPPRIRQILEAGERGDMPETPKAGDPLFQNVNNIIVGSNRLALEAAAARAKKLGYRPLILSSSMHGEAREVAKAHAAILRETATRGTPVKPPACLLSGGETIVTVNGKGKGGRNQEFALSLAIEIAGLPRVAALSAGTDGTDGPTDAAGALVSGATIDRAQAAGMDPHRFLAQNDSYPFFDALRDLIKTGPTGTNVMDVNILLAG